MHLNRQVLVLVNRDGLYALLHVWPVGSKHFSWAFKSFYEFANLDVFNRLF